MLVQSAGSGREPDGQPSYMFPLGKKHLSAEKTAKPRAIVVADDVAEIRQLVGHWLEELGHKVMPASNGREAIELVRDHPIDLLVTDLVMPGLDGLDAILAVNRIRPTTRILAISGGGRKMPVDAGLRLAKGVGADAILPKPFDRKQFLAAVERVMGD